MSSKGKVLEGLWVDELYLLQVIAEGIAPLLRGQDGMSDNEAKTWASRFAPEGTGTFGNTDTPIEDRCLTWVPQLDKPRKIVWKLGRSQRHVFWDCERCGRRNTDAAFCGECGKLRMGEPKIAQ